MKTVLAIDGGGVRGILPTRILEALQRRLEHPIARYFDVIAGTSSGAITALSLAQPDPIPAENLTAMFVKRAPQMFSRSWKQRLITANGWVGPKYDELALERVFYDAFGDLKLSDLARPVLVPAVNVHHQQAAFFSRPKDRPLEEMASNDYLIRDVLRATTAAPTYFRPAEITCSDGTRATFIDGGLFANNPAMYAAASVEASSWLGLRQVPISVISLGTGVQTRPFPHQAARGWGKLRWIQPVISMMGSGLDSAISYALNRGFEAENYLRFQTLLDRRPEDKIAPNDDLDDCSQKNMDLLIEWGDRLVEANRDDLDRAAEILTKRGLSRVE